MKCTRWMKRRWSGRLRLCGSGAAGSLAAIMLISQNPRIDLTYCLNVHPGERWADQERAVEECSLKVRDAVGKGAPFGLGLRVANLAAEELEDPELRGEIREIFRSEEHTSE